MVSKIDARLRAAALAVLVVLAVLVTGAQFRAMWKDDLIVPGPGVTATKMLSDYFPGLAGTAGDTEVFILEGKAPGATCFILGGTHPNEPSGCLTAMLLVERAQVSKGRLVVAPRGNRSGFTCNDPQEGSPQWIHFTLADGSVRAFRFGSRGTNPLHQWPDPDIYINPSGQRLSGSENRNLNRAYPGRPEGTLTEKAAYGIMEVIRQEKADISVDLHEASPEYPVIHAIVAHERSEDLAAMAVMDLDFDGIRMRLEKSPPTFYGLSHRAWGDYSETMALLMETANPSQGRLRGRTDEHLVLTGQDRFYVKAAELGRLYVPFDSHGHPIEERVGRHMSALAAIWRNAEFVGSMLPIEVEGLPDFAEIMEEGYGHFLNPAPAGAV
ncbi:MAG: succinylglutamate desuccinylase/aspartoacylase family protein [Clostridia bacterium]|nr:succinylglutamate desuccinylase/aspartoacylase family protein [Clostridia bacterium]